jgi:hypothetical protein
LNDELRFLRILFFDLGRVDIRDAKGRVEVVAAIVPKNHRQHPTVTAQTVSEINLAALTLNFQALLVFGF